MYVDVVLNHMAGTYPEDKVAIAGSTVDTANYDYPAVPFTKQDFHESCIAQDSDAHAVSLACIHTFPVILYPGYVCVDGGSTFESVLCKKRVVCTTLHLRHAIRR